MYSEITGTRKTLGDVDVLYHDGIYHLFHLVLPNHDFIAHAVSDNCFQWRRVENALFLGHPGSWDDSMLWTTHVTPHPFRDGWWRMFYTGISRRDQGLKQRIGMAESDNLYEWKKVPVHWEDHRSELPYELPGRAAQPPFEQDLASPYPLEPDPKYYESEIDEGRHWVSFRDPFYYREDGRGWLLTAGRVKHGPVTRRGCVAVMEEIASGQFEPCAPLHHPGLYDDIEVPNLFKLDSEYYLVGSMREDAKIRYWHTRQMGEPWRSYADNVLLAAGNYAGRICHDEQGILLWSFFTPGGLNRLTNNFMPPPKRLVRNENGHLHVKTFEGFEGQVMSCAKIHRFTSLIDDDCVSSVPISDSFELKCEAGFQMFALEEPFDCFRMRVILKLVEEGKVGIIFRLDRQTHDGYFISLDLFKGVAQLRAWGSGLDGSGEDMMQFQTLQAGYWAPEQRGRAELQVIAYGSYLELAIGDRVLLSLADQTFERGALGFYVESARLEVNGLSVEHFKSPVQSDEQLANG